MESLVIFKYLLFNDLILPSFNV